MLFAVLRESDQLFYYRSTPKHDAVRELRYDGTVIKNKYIGQTGDRNVLTRHLWQGAGPCHAVFSPDCPPGWSPIALHVVQWPGWVASLFVCAGISISFDCFTSKLTLIRDQPLFKDHWAARDCKLTWGVRCSHRAHETGCYLLYKLWLWRTSGFAVTLVRRTSDIISLFRPLHYLNLDTLSISGSTIIWISRILSYDISRELFIT